MTKVLEAEPFRAAMTNQGRISLPDFESLRQAVLLKRPVLRAILDKMGDFSLYEYAQYFAKRQNQSVPEDRKTELLSTFKEEIQKILGPNVAAKAIERLRRYYFVSTADHHGPLDHPFFLSSNLLSALPGVEGTQTDLTSVIVLACGSVSLENSSFPRGLVFHSELQDSMEKLPFFSTHIRPSLISHLSSYGREEMAKVEHSLEKKVKEGAISPQEREQITRLLEDVYLTPESLGFQTFSDQITYTNFHLWRRYFPAQSTPPDLIYLELERIVSQLLLNHHLEKETLINRFLFKKSSESEIFLQALDSIYSQRSNSGTFMFWAIPQGARYRIPVRRENNELVSLDGTYRLTLTPDALRSALLRREIIPNVILSLVVLGCYYGLKCQGGFSQVNYFTAIKKAYEDFAESVGDSESFEVCKGMVSDELCGDFTIAFLKRRNGELLPATGVDWALRGSDESWPSFVAQCRRLTLSETLDPFMPDFYKIIYPENERDTALAGITNQMMIQELSRKILACISE